MKLIKIFIVVALSWVVTNCAAVDVNQLSGIVVGNLTNYDPAIDKDKLNIWKVYIASVASSGATDSAHLYQNLTNAFLTDANLSWLGWNANRSVLDLAALNIANTVYPAHGVAYIQFPSQQPDQNSDNWGAVSLWTGAILQNPYTINQSTKMLESSGSSSDAYLEIGVDERYVLRSGPNDTDLPLFKSWEYEQNGLEFMLPLAKIPDIGATFGYIFANNVSTNISASTIVGNSDIYGEATLGIPFLRYCSSDYSWKMQTTIEVSGGFATDKEFDSVHPNLFVGGGFQGKFPVVSTNLPVYWFGRVGMAEIDQPLLSGTNVVFNSSNNGGLSEPVFYRTWRPTMATTIIVPVNNSLSLQMGGDVYFDANPASWNIRLGVTLNLANLANKLGSGLGISP